MSISQKPDGDARVAKRVVVVVNKNWEVDAALAAITSLKARPPRLQVPVLFDPFFPPDPPDPNGSARVKPRAVFNLVPTGDIIAEIWCLQDAMNPKKSSSSTSEKARVLPLIFGYGSAPAFTIAGGTAAFPDVAPVAGSVAIGCDVFVHDPFPGSGMPGSDGWTNPELEKLLASPASGRNALGPFTEATNRSGLRSSIEARFIAPPLASAAARIVHPSAAAVAVSVVNVTNPDDFAWTDRSGLDGLRKKVTGRPPASLETTHGVIRILSGAATPFLFVSGFANRVGFFDIEVGPREYAQNFVAAHNAGVAIGWLLPLIADFLAANP